MYWLYTGPGVVVYCCILVYTGVVVYWLYTGPGVVVYWLVLYCVLAVYWSWCCNVLAVLAVYWSWCCSVLAVYWSWCCNVLAVYWPGVVVYWCILVLVL